MWFEPPHGGIKSLASWPKIKGLPRGIVSIARLASKYLLAICLTG